jgi:hypothetical protein
MGSGSRAEIRARRSNPVSAGAFGTRGSDPHASLVRRRGDGRPAGPESAPTPAEAGNGSDCRAAFFGSDNHGDEYKNEIWTIHRPRPGRSPAPRTPAALTATLTVKTNHHRASLGHALLRHERVGCGGRLVTGTWQMHYDLESLPQVGRSFEDFSGFSGLAPDGGRAQ